MNAVTSWRALPAIYIRLLLPIRFWHEGVDVPKAKVGVVLGGKSSGRQAIQRLGRLLRRQGEERGGFVRSGLRRNQGSNTFEGA